jgi:ubiquitin C-terminal hydrolase
MALDVKNLLNLEESLKKWIKPEFIPDASCDSCNQKGKTKRYMIKKLPNVLIVHLKRFSLNY